MPVKDSLEIAATEFKAKCLQLIKEVHERKQHSVVITKRGKPFAKLVPIDAPKTEFYGCMPGKARIHGDLTEPTGGDWEALDS
jgi:prevent-host-death family protein